MLVSVLISNIGISQSLCLNQLLFEVETFFFSYIHHNNKQENIIFMHINIVKDWEQKTVASHSQSRAVALALALALAVAVAVALTVAVVVMLSPPSGQTARLCTREALTFAFKR